MIIPASAADLPGQYDVIDLFSAAEYVAGTVPGDKPMASYSGRSLTLSWVPQYSLDVYKIVFGITLSTSASSIYLNSKLCTYLETVGDIRYYSVDSANMQNGLTLTINFSSSTSHTVNLMYCVGLYAGQTALSSGTFKYTNIDNNNVTVPGNLPFVYFNANFTSSANRVFQAYYDLPKVPVDYFTAYFRVTGVEDMQVRTAEIYDGDTSVYSVPCDVNISYINASFPTGYTNIAKQVIVSVDLSGIRLDSLSDPRIYIGFNPATTPSGNGKYTWGVVAVHAVYGTYPQVVPWYTTFWSKLNGSLSSLTGIVDSGFSAVLDCLYSLVDPPADVSKTDDVNDQSSVIDQNNDVIASVTKPDVNDIQVDVSDIVSNNDITAGTQVLTIFVSNDIFVNVIIIALVLATAGYVLYGKK